MKRSEAIRIISDLFSELNIPNHEEEAIRALIKVEEMGMQPPAVKEPCETFVLHQGKYIKTEDSFMFTHKWDQE